MDFLIFYQSVSIFFYKKYQLIMILKYCLATWALKQLLFFFNHSLKRSSNSGLFFLDGFFCNNNFWRQKTKTGGIYIYIYINRWNIIGWVISNFKFLKHSTRKQQLLKKNSYISNIVFPSRSIQIISRSWSTFFHLTPLCCKCYPTCEFLQRKKIFLWFLLLLLDLMMTVWEKSKWEVL